MPTLLTLRLVVSYDGGLVELFHPGYGRLCAAAGEDPQGSEAGRHSRDLEALKSIVEGG